MRILYSFIPSRHKGNHVIIDNWPLQLLKALNDNSRFSITLYQGNYLSYKHHVLGQTTSFSKEQKENGQASSKNISNP